MLDDIALVFSEERLADFIVAVSDNSSPPVDVNDLDGYTRCGQYSGTPGLESTITCPADVGGQYVYIYLPGANYLTLCEVEVYGTSKALHI